jgi:DNA mismatch repair protein MutS
VKRQPVSLLRPGGGDGEQPSRLRRLSDRSAADLDLGAAVRALAVDAERREEVEGILAGLCQEEDTIRYRQEVLADLLADEELAAGLQALASEMSCLKRYRQAREPAELLYEVTWRLGELESYTDCIEKLAELLQAHRNGLRSRGLRRLGAAVAEIRDQEIFRNLRRELPDLLGRVRGISSVTVGINLDRDLRPQEATLLSIGRRRFRGPSDSLLGRLFGRLKRGDWEGIAPLHSMPAAGAGEERSPYLRPAMVPLFRDLSEVLARSCRPVAAALKHYVQLESSFLVGIAAELSFYLGALRLIRRLEQLGLTMCRPEIVPAGQGVCRVGRAYNLNLALRFSEEDAKDVGARIVRNDVSFGPEGNIFILTGPNRGGKTTYMQGVGLIQVLAQAGLYVPAEEAWISPVDGIYTHFPAGEHPELDTGRLGEEARRLRELFASATPSSLILLNESLSTTSPGESYVLARELARILRLLGARAIYTTHIHELAAQVDRLNRDGPGGGRLASLVSLVEETGDSSSVRRTFRIVPAPPAGSSYAEEIASSHGVSYDQLRELLRERGILP